MRIVSKPPGRACIASLAIAFLFLTLIPTSLARSRISLKSGKQRVSTSRKAKPAPRRSKRTVRRTPAARPVPAGTIIQGKASWYGPGFHGRRTASGERFNRHAHTLAHRGLPFNTRVRIVNMQNGRSAVGRVNDRGPHVRGRVVDLSEALARRLGIRGVARVRCEVLGGTSAGKKLLSGEVEPQAVQVRPSAKAARTRAATASAPRPRPAVVQPEQPTSAPEPSVVPEMAPAEPVGAPEPIVGVDYFAPGALGAEALGDHR